MKFVPAFAAALAAAVSLSGAATAQDRVVVREHTSGPGGERTVVREHSVAPVNRRVVVSQHTVVRHDNGWHGPRARTRCDWRWRGHHRVRVCRTVRWR